MKNSFIFYSMLTRTWNGILYSGNVCNISSGKKKYIYISLAEMNFYSVYLEFKAFFCE